MSEAQASDIVGSTKQVGILCDFAAGFTMFYPAILNPRPRLSQVLWDLVHAKTTLGQLEATTCMSEMAAILVGTWNPAYSLQIM